MSSIVRMILKSLIAYVKELWDNFKLQKKKEEVIKQKEKSDDAVKEANDSYNEFMDKLGYYKQRKRNDVRDDS